jgi:hypothetical protein
MSTVRAAIIRATSIVVLLSFGMAGCAMAGDHVRGYDCSEFANTFFKKPLKATIAEFSDYDVDKQYAIYICGNQYMHPPMIHLAEPFAKEGEKVVDFLKARLLEARDDLTVRDIVLVFTWMARQKTYDVAGDSNLMRITEEKVSRMKNLDWRRLSEHDLNEIRW